MKLPDRLDYEETRWQHDGDAHWSPAVTCRTPGCPWTYTATWDDLADDGTVDWDVLHPPHPCASCERCTYNPGPDCGKAEHPHCPTCGHCKGRHADQTSWA